MSTFESVKLPNSNGVEWVKHHAVSVAIFDGSDFFSAIKPYFDVNSFASNGVPLPGTAAGGLATGMSIHIDNKWGQPPFSGSGDDADRNMVFLLRSSSCATYTSCPEPPASSFPESRTTSRSGAIGVSRRSSARQITPATSIC